MNVSTMNIIVLILLAVVMMICTFTDLKERKIYNVVTISAIALIVIIRFMHHPQGVVMYLWGVVPAIVLLIAAYVTKGKALGGGDILLILFIGLTVGGIGTLMTLLYAFVIALLTSAVLYVAANKKITKVPLAPFLLVGIVAFYLQPHWLVPIVFG